MVNPKLELRPRGAHAQLSPLSRTACHKTPEGGQAQGLVLLYCWATEDTGRSDFLFHLQSSPVGLNWLCISTPEELFKNMDAQNLPQTR